MDRIEKIANSIINQPIEGLLYDLDLLPEQCRNDTNNIRRSIIEKQREEIERLWEALNKYGCHLNGCDLNFSGPCNCGYTDFEEEYQALKEK